MGAPWQTRWFLLGSALGLAFLDQLTKDLARDAIGQLDTIMLIPGVLHLTATENTGSLFGLLKGQQLPLIALSLAVIAVLVYLMVAERLPDERLVRVCAVLLLAGSLGNLADRILRGAVFDFVDVQVWPVFNLADAMLSAGVIGLLAREIFPALARKKAEKKAD